LTLVKPVSLGIGADATNLAACRAARTYTGVMALFQGFFFLILGVLLVIVVYQSLAKGWLPFGPRGFSGQVRFTRTEQPVGYWIAFMLFGAMGLWAVYAGVGILFGWMAPLPLN